VVPAFGAGDDPQEGRDIPVRRVAVAHLLVVLDQGGNGRGVIAHAGNLFQLGHALTGGNSEERHALLLRHLVVGRLETDPPHLVGAGIGKAEPPPAVADEAGAAHAEFWGV
jgi:hypothetical protein